METRTLSNRTGYKSFEDYGYPAKLTYADVNMSAILNMVKLANKCQQFMKYECMHSTITHDHRTYFTGGIETTAQKYFPGGDPVKGGCACFRDGTCDGGVF